MSMIPKNIKLGLAYTYIVYVSEVHGYVYDVNCLFSHITYISSRLSLMEYRYLYIKWQFLIYNHN